MDASGAFENVNWDTIFVKLAKKNNIRVIRCIWLIYRFNRYETRWEKSRANITFCATKGTKQGGILSGFIFCEYMSILDDRLKKVPGRMLFGLLWNALFYADDVILIGLNLAHAQLLLRICEGFEADGYIKWNSLKTRVMYLTQSNRLKTIPRLSLLFLKGKQLERCICFKYLGYVLNHRVTDDDSILRQARRLYAITNNILADLPLHLLDNSRLRKIATAYSNVYLLPVLSDSTHKSWQKLKTAHRYFVANVTQFYKRAKSYWNPDLGIYNAKNRYIYGRLRVPTLDTMVFNQKFRFSQRFSKYISSISSV